MPRCTLVLPLPLLHDHRACRSRFLQSEVDCIQINIHRLDVITTLKSCQFMPDPTRTTGASKNSLRGSFFTGRLYGVSRTNRPRPPRGALPTPPLTEAPPAMHRFEFTEKFQARNLSFEHLFLLLLLLLLLLLFLLLLRLRLHASIDSVARA